jgi:hypothetical protein
MSLSVRRLKFSLKPNVCSFSAQHPTIAPEQGSEFFYECSFQGAFRPEKALKRDVWRWQLCGTPSVHHLKSQGTLGDDTMQNLITLRAKCHEAFHRPRAFNREDDSNKPVDERLRISDYSRAVIPRYFTEQLS